MCTMVWWYRLETTPNLSTRALWQPPTFWRSAIRDISGASGRKGEGNENFVYSSQWDFRRSLTWHKIFRHVTSGFTSHPKEGVLRIFIALKVHRLGRVRTRNLWAQWRSHEEDWRTISLRDAGLYLRMYMTSSSSPSWEPNNSRVYWSPRTCLDEFILWHQFCVCSCFPPYMTRLMNKNFLEETPTLHQILQSISWCKRTWPRWADVGGHMCAIRRLSPSFLALTQRKILKVSLWLFMCVCPYLTAENRWRGFH
jgi:hypothetical protein